MPRFREFLAAVSGQAARSDALKAAAIDGLTLLLDRRYDPGDKKRSHLLHLHHGDPDPDLCRLPRHWAKTRPAATAGLIGTAGSNWRRRQQAEAVLVLDAAGFPPEGDDCDARLLCRAFELGWRHFITYGYKGQRFLGCGFGLDTDEVRIDVYGSTGDYLASGIDGMAIHVHGNAQDQLGQIMKRGKLVVYGDVGQTFMYGAKGGEVYVLGNAAGRPLINAVGRPRVVINGTALDFLAESFMAGDSSNRRRLRHRQRPGVRRPGTPAAAAQPLSRQQPLLPGLRRRHLHPRPLPAGGGRAVERRRVRRPHRRRTGT